MTNISPCYPEKRFVRAISFPSNKIRVIAGDLMRTREKAGENFEYGRKYKNAGDTRQMRVTWHIWQRHMSIQFQEQYTNILR